MTVRTLKKKFSNEEIVKLSEEILPKLENSKINIILFDVPVEVDFDEFEDLFVYSEEITINLQTNQVIPLFRGKFSKKKNNKISAVVMLKDNHFRGLINPLNNRIIPHDIKKLFNFIDVRVDENA